MSLKGACTLEVAQRGQVSPGTAGYELANSASDLSDLHATALRSYRVPPERDETFEEAETQFLANRAEMLDEHAIDEFIRAAALLSKFGRRKSMNRARSSYGLKHDAERMSGETASRTG